jgi:nicotinate dehydrogenase subunit A
MAVPVPAILRSFGKRLQPEGAHTRMSTSLVVNGVASEVAADPDTPLLDVLRGELGLLGSRFGCGMGLCGACMVLIDGRPMAACDTPLWAVDGAVTTVEGLADGDRLHPVQQAVLDGQAAQCGFCTSGLLISAAALLAENPDADEAAVVRALDRHLCRCGIQQRMVAAVVRAGRATP